MLLGLEDSGSRMSRLGSGLVVRDSIISIDDHVRHIRSVTLDDVHRVLKRILGQPRAVSAVGPLAGGHDALEAFANS